MSDREESTQGNEEFPVNNNLEPQYLNGTHREETNGEKAFALLGEFLEQDEWNPQRLKGRNTYQVQFRGKNGNLNCFAQIQMEREAFIFYVICPVIIPEEMRPIVAEYVLRANYGLIIGNFEMDYDDGEIRYKSSLAFKGQTLTPEFIRNAIYPAVRTMDRYLPGFLRILYGGKKAEEAIIEIEGD